MHAYAIRRESYASALHGTSYINCIGTPSRHSWEIASGHANVFFIIFVHNKNVCMLLLYYVQHILYTYNVCKPYTRKMGIYVPIYNIYM